MMIMMMMVASSQHNPWLNTAADFMQRGWIERQVTHLLNLALTYFSRFMRQDWFVGRVGIDSAADQALEATRHCPMAWEAHSIGSCDCCHIATLIGRDGDGRAAEGAWRAQSLPLHRRYFA